MSFGHPLLYFRFCCVASLDSNLPFFAFCFFAFCLFASSLFRFCLFAPSLLIVIMRLPKTISLQVGRKLADKTKDEIMTEVLRVFAGFDVKAVQGRPCHLPFSRALLGGQIVFGKASFWFVVFYLGGRSPYYACARFRFSFRGGCQILGGCFRGLWCSQVCQKADFSFQSKHL